MLSFFFQILTFGTVIMLNRIAYIVFNIVKKRHYRAYTGKKSHKPIKTMIIAGSGGHTTEMARLVGALTTIYRPRHYIVANTDNMSEDKIHALEKNKPQNIKDSSMETGQYYISKVPRSRELRQLWWSSVFSTLHACVYSFPLVFASRPDLILCNGPGTSIPLCAAGFLLRILFIKEVKLVYVESVCRVESLSLSAKLLYYFADHVIIQWPGLQESYPLTTYIGRVV